MTYKFQRSYVGDSNKGFLKGDEVPGDFDEQKIEKLLLAGIIFKIESPSEFLKAVEESDVENLDPERKPRGKKG